MKNKLLFIKKAIANPGVVGAIAPSSKKLGRAIANECLILSETGKVVEVGCGEGVISRKLAKQNLLGEIVEIDPTLAKSVAERMPGTKMVIGDAAEVPFNEEMGCDVVASSVPFNILPKEVRGAILGNIILQMGEYFHVVQYTYNPRFCLSKIDKRYKLINRKLIIGNLPPAWVLSYLVRS